MLRAVSLRQALLLTGYLELGSKARSSGGGGARQSESLSCGFDTALVQVTHEKRIFSRVGILCIHRDCSGRRIDRRPHRHPNDRFVTVLEGTWYTGTGDTFDPARAVPLRPGSFMMHPAKAVHWDGSRGDETVVVQIIGYGPGTSTLVDATKSFWIEVPH
jgi:hypothetical protein